MSLLSRGVNWTSFGEIQRLRRAGPQQALPGRPVAGSLAVERACANVTPALVSASTRTRGHGFCQQCIEEIPPRCTQKSASYATAAIQLCKRTWPMRAATGQAQFLITCDPLEHFSARRRVGYQTPKIGADYKFWLAGINQLTAIAPDIARRLPVPQSEWGCLSAQCN